MAQAFFPKRLAPLYGLVLALLLPVAVLQEFWWHVHPLVNIGYLFLLAAIVYYSLREYRLERETGGHAGGHGPRLAAQLVMVAMFMALSWGALMLLYSLLAGHPGWKWAGAIARDNRLVRDIAWYGLGLGLFLVAYWLAHRFPGVRFDFNLRWRFKLDDFGILVGLSAATCTALMIYMHFNADKHSAMHAFGATGEVPLVLYWAGGVLFSLVNSLFEELWWRGVLLGSLSKLLHPTRAVLLQALAFGIFHWNGRPQGILGLILAGTWGGLLGWWVIRRGSIWPAVIVHFFADMLIFAYTN